MTTIGVGMIVKNEEKDLPRCLESLLSLTPDYLCVIDTGSTDRTEMVVRMWCDKHGIPYTFRTYLEASEHVGGQWRLCDFGKARNEYVDHLDFKVDWLLWMDADDEFVDADRKDAFVGEMVHLILDCFRIQLVPPNFGHRV